MSAILRIVKNTLALIMSGLLTQALNFLSIVYLARVLGPEYFGQISFAMAIIIYFTMASSMGLPLLGTREIARDNRFVLYYVGNILSMRLSLSIVCFFLISMLAFFLHVKIEVKSLVVLYGLTLFPSALLLDWAFQGIERMEFIGISRITNISLYTLALYAFISSSQQLLFIPLFFLGSSFIAAFLLMFIFHIAFHCPQLKVNLKAWPLLFKSALPFGLSLIMIQVFYYIDSVMLGFMTNYDSVGLYSAASKVVFLCVTIGGAYFDAIYPVVSRLYKESMRSLSRLQAVNAKITIIFAMPMAIGGSILSKPLMEAIFGPLYDGGVIAFRILIWSGAINYINMIYSRGLWACDKQNVFLKIVTTQAIANVLLNLIFIPIYGIVGAAISTTTAEIIGLWLSYIGFAKVIHVPFLSYVIKPFICSVIMALFLVIGLISLGLKLPLLLCIGATVYLLTLYLFGGVTKQEIMLWKTFLQGEPATHTQ